MYKWISLWCVALSVVFPVAAKAMYEPYLTTVNVPIARLLSNLYKKQSQIRSEDKEHLADNEFKIGRLFAMAFARHDGTIPVMGHLNEREKSRIEASDEVLYPFYPAQVWPAYRQFSISSQATDSERDRYFLSAAIDHYRKALALQPNNDDISLGLAWSLEQNNDIDEAKAIYRDIVSKSKSSTDSFYTPNERAYEAALYLVNILDAKENSDEIEHLKALPKPDYKPHFITPIAIPLTKKIAADQLLAPANIKFDLGFGKRSYEAWPSENVGWLVWDKNNQGKVTDGTEMFGNFSFSLFWRNGYEALAALDDNQDGKLDGDELRHLSIWNDTNCDGVSERSEVIPLPKLGIVSLSCKCTSDSKGLLYSHDGVVFQSGETRATYDVIVPERALLVRQQL